MKPKQLVIAFLIVVFMWLAFPVVVYAQTATPPEKPVFTADDAWAFWGFALSLAAAYLPGVKQWYDSLESTKKPLVMAAGLFALCAGKMLVVCWGQWAQILVVWPDYLKVFVEALLVNAATFTYAVKQYKQAQLMAEFEAAADQPYLPEAEKQ